MTSSAQWQESDLIPYAPDPYPFEDENALSFLQWLRSVLTNDVNANNHNNRVGMVMKFLPDLKQATVGWTITEAKILMKAFHPDKWNNNSWSEYAKYFQTRATQFKFQIQDGRHGINANLFGSQLNCAINQYDFERYHTIDEWKKR